jgi:hypothetical protein
MSLGVDAGIVNLSAPIGRRLASVCIALPGGAKSEAFRIDLTKLGTSQLLCGGNHLWYVAPVSPSLLCNPPPIVDWYRSLRRASCCTGHSFRYRVERASVTTVVTVYDAPPRRLGEQHLQSGTDEANQLSLKVDVSGLSVILLDSTSMRANPPPLLRVRTPNINMWATISPENDPRYIAVCLS